MFPEVVEKEKIRQFLYGELASPGELEEFEEQIFADDDLFAEIQAAEMELIDRFVRLRMTAAEKQKFEQFYLVTPERRVRVAQAATFHRELDALRARAGAAAGEHAVSWFERLFGSTFTFAGAQLAMAAAILLLAVGMGWFAYDGWWTRQELAAARDRQQVLETELNEKLAGKEKELQDRLNEQRVGDSAAISALQTEIDQLRGRLDEVQQKSPAVNTALPLGQTPAIATVILTSARRMGGFATPVKLNKDTRVLNLLVPISTLSGATFDVAIVRDSDNSVVVKTTGNKPREAGSRKLISQSIPTAGLADGSYKVTVRSEKGEEKTMRFVVTRK